MMMIKDQMEKIYNDLPPSEIPWNIETPPEALKSIVTGGKVKPCKTIDLGCGTGNYAIYMASQGFDVTGIDISSTAIEFAKKSANQRGIKCNFTVADVLGELNDILGKFDFAFDWELLHHILPSDREKYVNNVYHLLNPGGLYLSVCFSENNTQFGGEGKYRTTPLNTTLYFSSEEEMRNLFKSLFIIEELNTIEIKGKFGPHQVIYSLLKRGYK
jgi:2-polyprenyl-3-methyl-5-hydroxy-6-metoxy-1,4-benzoquinol methylase